MSIEKTAAAVVTQVHVVADEVQANPQSVNTASLKTLENLCIKLETACGNG